MELRLVIRRTRIIGSQAQLWPDWRYHTFVTNLNQTDTDTDTDTEDRGHRIIEADRYHRHHATCELAIRDLKNSGGLAHLPSGRFAANYPNSADPTPELIGGFRVRASATPARTKYFLESYTAFNTYPR